MQLPAKIDTREELSIDEIRNQLINKFHHVGFMDDDKGLTSDINQSIRDWRS